MAAYTVAEPGTEYNPCTEECRHTSCVEARRRAKQRCYKCGQPIGWATRYYCYADGDLEHALCPARKEE
jgi:hypothetical protein